MNFAPGLKPPAAGGSGPGSGNRTTMENLEKQLVCPVCLEMFSKPVVILPCQHNLCRKCASDVFQASSPPWTSRGPPALSAAGGRFRCPSCRHEVALDRHGVFGLQRNLLVENIIDIYRQQEASRLVKVKPEQTHTQQQLVCDEHHDEKINIYCISCQTPTCSMCKVFGRHQGCDVAPLAGVYVSHKAELSDGIAMLVASNDHIQTAISHMEDVCRAVEENGQHQRDQLYRRFQALEEALEERKQELVGRIAAEQDDKLRHVRSLVRHHSDHLEAALALVESAIQSMEETHMAPFIQNTTLILDRMAAAAGASDVQRLEPGYDDMSHFSIDTDALSDVLRNMDFCCGAADDEEEDPDEEPEPDLCSRC